MSRDIVRFIAIVIDNGDMRDSWIAREAIEDVNSARTGADLEESSHYFASGIGQSPVACQTS